MSPKKSSYVDALPKADQVELIIPFVKKEYKTRKHFSYFKFFVPENVDSFKLNISDCTIRHQIKVQVLSQNIQFFPVIKRGIVPIFTDENNSFSSKRHVINTSWKEDV